jgi:hypothetical protein
MGRVGLVTSMVANRTHITALRAGRATLPPVARGCEVVQGDGLDTVSDR